MEITGSALVTDKVRLDNLIKLDTLLCLSIKDEAS
jgi:hypothetical protein